MNLSFRHLLAELVWELSGWTICFSEASVLSVVQDQDTIDFTDNDLSSLGNFPFFPRLRTLLLARNRINHIQPNLGSSIPSLTTLVLTSNNLSELADVESLRTLPNLTHLVLLENPITRKEVSKTCSYRELPDL